MNDAPTPTSGQHERRIDPVIATGLLLVALATAFRAWALYPSWFYFDDFELLIDAQGAGSGIPNLLKPFNGHLMPGGRIIAWVIEQSGQLNWGLTATITLGLQCLANLAALWTFTTLFGRRWAVLVPCALYWFSTMTLPATMWWIASINQIPLQIALFLSVGAWVRYLRDRDLRWLLATGLAVALGLAFYVKALLLFPLLGYLAVVYFMSGGLAERARSLRRLWPALALLGPIGAVYVVYYRANAAQPLEGTSLRLLGDLLENMIGTAFSTALVGGPWDWVSTAPPNAFADPPAWSVHAAWVVISLVVLTSVLTRRRALRAWVLLAGYLLGLFTLLITSRAQVYGQIIGLEYRYLTDAACVASLALGLAFLRLHGAPGSSARREFPLLLLRPRPWMITAIVALIVASSLASQVRYVRYWHEQNAISSYLKTFASELRREGYVDIVDVVAPDGENRGLTGSNVSPRTFLPLLENKARFPEASERLTMVASTGVLHHVLVEPGVVSKPGPRDECGWPVTSKGRRIPLTAQAFDYVWWLQIGYLSSADSPVTVSAGDSAVDTEVQRGLNTLYVRAEGTFDEVRIDGLDDDVTLCVDTIIVGQPVPGGVLE